MRRIRLSLITAITVMLLFTITGSAQQAASEKRLVILFTHDLHSYLLPEHVTSSTNEPTTEGGYAKLSALIDHYRTIHKDNVLLVDGGDFSMGTLFHTSFTTNSLELRLMAKMGYEVTTLGNHEFDFHPLGLAGSLTEAKKHSTNLPAIVAANTTFSPTPTERDKTLRQAFQAYPVKEYTVINKSGMRIGIFGLIGNDAANDSPFASPVVFNNPIATAKRIVDLLKNKEKVDMIVCLSHSGTWANKKQSEDEILPAKVPGIDVIVSGHTHTVLSKPIIINKTVIVSAGCYGKYLGVLEIALNNGAKNVSYSLVPVNQATPENSDISKELETYKLTVDREYLAPYGLTFDQIIGDSTFDMETVDYSHDHPGETGIGDFITDAFREAIEKAEGDKYDYVHVAIEPLGNIRSTLLKGNITVADLFRVLSLGRGTDGTPGYPLLTTYLTGGDLKKLLEVETTVSHMKDDAHLQVSGLRCTFNPHRMPFDRVTSLQVKDTDGTYRPADPKKLYRVAMNHYTAMMVQYVGKVSYGLLTFTPRKKSGQPMTNIEDGIVPAGNLLSGVIQIKEWIALATYLQSLPDTDGNGIPNIPGRYKNLEGRIVSQPSWNPITIIAGGNFITYGALAAVIVIIVIIIGAVWLITWLVKRKKRI